MQGTPSSHIENLGLHGPQVAQKIADRGASDLSHLADSLPSMGKAESDCCADFGERQGSAGVGQDRARMSDEELDAAITRACTASEGWYSQFKHLNDLTCLDMAYHFMWIARNLQRLKGHVA